ncbi:MAG: ATP-dependent DNA helicase RecG [Parcubacteria group bacterium CG11_big_fil_rev_8_21_14_0_20_39_14]|nr:MAG: ATP-dependent DNA helicase RecG [Parcubacteria group bacterium CG11_big_fil_rev_8_21_14_0_20_39_14]
MTLFSPVEQISRIGPAFQKRLKKLGIKTIKDLLYHFPSRYEDLSKITPIAKIRFGEAVTVIGKILNIKSSRTWKKKISLTEALIQDESGTLPAIWFHQPYLLKILKPGQFFLFSGKPALKKNQLYLSNPAFEKIDQADNINTGGLIHTGRIVPIYPATEGLSSRYFRYILKNILAYFDKKIPDPLPTETRENQKLLEINKALWQIHFPDTEKSAEEARRRFAFEEIFLIQLWALIERIRLRKEKALKFEINLPLIQKLIKSLPYKLTDGQKKSAWQILKDLEKPYPMNRLLEGDVGSGKTVIAAIAALNCASQKGQVAIMAPTEILAKQHFREFPKLLKNFKLSIALLTGKEDKIASKKLKGEVLEISRQKILEKIAKAEIDILIGTHALIQKNVIFKNLALAIVDEQHRFGVEQRAKLTRSRTIPHLLSMTATPIPRTLALTIYSDLDLSLISELPKGRKKIITKIVSPAGRLEVFEFIRLEANQGRQTFIICPLIEESEKLRVKAAVKEHEQLSQKFFSDLKVGLLHGRMKTREKGKIMKDFKAGKLNILVSTSVVEVGIDIPNATIMVIEGADRFGLAQLYQFRGRVGRNIFQSYCFLFTDSRAKRTHQRLKALIGAEDGFKLSEKDLEIRGPGDLAGTRQWGLPDLAMASLSDLSLIEAAKKEAVAILEKDIQLKKHPLLKERVESFKKRIHLE